MDFLFLWGTTKNPSEFIVFAENSSKGAGGRGGWSAGELDNQNKTWNNQKFERVSENPVDKI